MKLGLIGTGRIGEMHAQTLLGLDSVEGMLIADADRTRAENLAETLGTDSVANVDDLFWSRVDGVVIAAATSAHAELIHRALDHELPVFCEKPVALDVSSTRNVVERAAQASVPVQIGFQRRFDAGYRAARQAVHSGQLGWLHTLRAVTADQDPPPASYIPTSGGLFRDCSVHDFDILRWLTGCEVHSVYATGTNRGASFFRQAGDVDTSAALLTLDDGTVASVTATRYNGAGHDVRLEVCGSDAAMFVGHDERSPLPSAEAGVAWPSGKPYATFMERFRDAYVTELSAFTDVVAGRAENPCTPEEALEALYVAEACELSRTEERGVEVAEVRSRESAPT